jgi:hypothetical protein
MRYNQKAFVEAFPIAIFLLSVPKAAGCHVGHGDEFQATGGTERVQVNPETDPMLGIVVTAIDATTADGSGVMVPFTALVDADGKQLVFVQYDNYYEPVEVTTGATQGVFGVAVRNGLLLVDNYNQKFAEGMPLKDVIINGSLERVNAILMTALTSALGMSPLAIASGAGNEILPPLAIVVLGGLFTSTALTLLVIPALYAQFGKNLMPKPKPAVVEISSFFSTESSTEAG